MHLSNEYRNRIGLYTKKAHCLCQGEKRGRVKWELSLKPGATREGELNAERLREHGSFKGKIADMVHHATNKRTEDEPGQKGTP